MADNRPEGREKNVTGTGKGVYKRGEGLHTGGPVGREDGYQGRKESTTPSGGSKRTTRGGGSPLLIIILAAVLLLGGGGAGLGGLFGGGSTTNTTNTQNTYTPPVQNTVPSGQPVTPSASAGSYFGNSSGSSILSALLGGSSAGYSGGGTVSSGWTTTANTGRLNTSVAAGSRAKRTQILGNGRDTVTIMVYMCGTDLESRNGMGSSDLQEMLNASFGDNVNLVVYTGGCKQWQNNMVSNSINEVYQIRNGQIGKIAEDGSRVMTDPTTLARYIQFCAKQFPANRNVLIFWDHGGGSLSGYGYDEKNPSAGSMTLSGINQALQSGGVTFDFIGFDACLMATLETALTLEPYADYLIASEETEPGVGWYYTNWLTELGKNTSMSTLEVGKNITDDFVTVCAQKCRGQNTTLSVVDLAELAHTVPDRLKSFASGTSQLLQSNQYEVVSDARSSTREFAVSNKIDQVDLVHLAYNLNTTESKALAQALLSAVKYNRTSSGITNAYGLSIYFPYQRTSKVKNAVATYEAIGMDSDYARCIQQFASMETGGQAVAGGTASPLSALLGGGLTGSGTGSVAGMDAITDILGALLTSGGSSSGGFFGRSLDMDDAADFISGHQLDSSALVWTTSGGVAQMRLSQEQWALVHDLQLNVFYDDGEGYIDLGLDNTFSFTEDGALLGVYDGTWLAIDGQVIPYYYEGGTFDGDSFTITGRVPVLLNGQRAELLIVFDNEHPYGEITGARAVYAAGETETVAKAVTELAEGDVIDLICDYYTYEGDYQDSYLFGEQIVWDGTQEISNVVLPGKENAVATYLLTDIYNQEYWTPTLP